MHWYYWYVHDNKSKNIRIFVYIHIICIWTRTDQGSLSGYITARVWPLLLFWTSTARSWSRLWTPTCLETAYWTTTLLREGKEGRPMEALSTRITLYRKASLATAQYFPQDLRISYSHSRTECLHESSNSDWVASPSSANISSRNGEQGEWALADHPVLLRAHPHWRPKGPEHLQHLQGAKHCPIAFH